MSNATFITSIFIGVSVVFTLGYVLHKQHTQPKDCSVLTIGILQTSSLPPLDAARNGLIDYFTHHCTSKKVEFIVQNGQGSAQQLHSIAKSFHANKHIDAIVALATPAAQAMAHVEKEKPIIIAAVSDPSAAGLVQPGGNVCGVHDMNDVNQAINLLTAFAPTAQRVALMYNPGEVNSCVMIKKMEAELAQKHITPIKIGINNEAEVPAAVSVACKSADAILTPSDNLVSLSMPLIADHAIKTQRPLIVSLNESVELGALAACGIDYYTSGQQCAAVALQVLIDRKKPSDIQIVDPICNTIVINKKTLNLLRLDVPEFKKEVKMVGID